MIPLLRLVLIALIVVAAPTRAETRYVEGHGGVPLAVTVTGPENGPEILFLHGIGMGAESFAPQLESELAQSYRMVAFDLRGHGMSGKPIEAEAYTLRDVWAGDVRKVIEATGLKRPVIVAWSYGTLVTADYLFASGASGISGLVMVAAHGGIAPPAQTPGATDAAAMAQMSRYYALRNSPSLADQTESVTILAPYLYEQTEEGPSQEWREAAATLGVLVPPYAQPHLRAHPRDNTALAKVLEKSPVMLVHGTEDFALTPADLEAAKVALPQMQVETFEASGHSPFAERPAKFNALLAAFVDANWSACHD